MEKKKIQTACIIDDDQIFVYGIQKMINVLELCDNIMVYKNGAEAIKYLKPALESSQDVPDVILLDINMPVLDGWGFLEEFTKIKTKDKKKITIYMVSSSIDNADLERAKKNEYLSDFVIKPVDEKDLVKMFE